MYRDNSNAFKRYSAHVQVILAPVVLEKKIFKLHKNILINSLSTPKGQKYFLTLELYYIFITTFIN